MKQLIQLSAFFLGASIFALIGPLGASTAFGQNATPPTAAPKNIASRLADAKLTGEWSSDCSGELRKIVLANPDGTVSDIVLDEGQLFQKERIVDFVVIDATTFLIKKEVRGDRTSPRISLEKYRHEGATRRLIERRWEDAPPTQYSVFEGKNVAQVFGEPIPVDKRTDTSLERLCEQKFAPQLVLPRIGSHEVESLLQAVRGSARCNIKNVPHSYQTPIYGRDVLWIEVNSETLDRVFLRDDALLRRMLDGVLAAGLAYCKNELAQRRVSAIPSTSAIFIYGPIFSNKVAQSSPSELLAWKSDREKWTVQNDQMVRMAQDLDRRQMSADAQRRIASRKAAVQAAETERQANLRGAAREKFISDFGVQSWPRFAEIAANPFRFKNSTVAVYGLFLRMLSEKEALFDSSIRGSVPAHTGDIIVSDVPATMFSGGEQAILAMKVVGTRQFKSPTGEISVPDLRYIQAYICRQDGCKDFLN